jgi:hypothetical protein
MTVCPPLSISTVQFANATRLSADIWIGTISDGQHFIVSQRYIVDDLGTTWHLDPGWQATATQFFPYPAYAVSYVRAIIFRTL